MALINTGAELFVFDNGAGYSGKNYVVTDNANQTIDLTDEANSAIASIVSGDYIPVTAMEIEGNTITALSGYTFNVDSNSAEYANSAASADHANSADYASTARYDQAGNVIHQTYTTYSYVTSALLKKQDLISFNYTSGGEISGIGNSAIYSVGGGGGGGTTYSAGNNIDITNGTISVTGVQLPMSAGDNIEITNNYINVTGVATSSDLDNYYTKTETSSAPQISAALNKKQDSLTNAQLSAISSVSGKQDSLTNAQLSAISSVSGKQNALTNAQLSAISSVSSNYTSLYKMITAISASISAQWALSAGTGLKITNDASTRVSTISLS